jgi:hypothetical protein
MFPGPCLAARLLQHPFPDRHDEPGVLSDSDECIRSEEPPLWMFPANERLGPDDISGRQVHDGLVHETQLVAVDRTVQGVLRPQLILDGTAAVGSVVGEGELGADFGRPPGPDESRCWDYDGLALGGRVSGTRAERAASARLSIRDAVVDDDVGGGVVLFGTGDSPPPARARRSNLLVGDGSSFGVTRSN